MNTLKYCIIGLRRWGLKGVINKIRSEFRQKKRAKWFRRNAVAYPCTNPEPGFTIVASLSSTSALDKTMRDFCFSLRDAGVPFQTYDIGPNLVPEEDIRPILTPREEFRITRYTHLVEVWSSMVPKGLVPTHARILFWEFTDGLLEGLPSLERHPSDIIAMSDFNYDYFKRVFSDRCVCKILYPLRIETEGVLDKLAARRAFGIPEDDFVVFYNFSFSSGWGRKNPLGAVRAFAQAFRDVPNARLVLKSLHKDEYSERVAELEQAASEGGVSGRVQFVDGYISQQSVFNLTNACDIYLSLHRAEGFGIGIAEAMSLAKPVVVTNYSAVTEFCQPDTACLVPYELVPGERNDLPWYSGVGKWAEPDITAAARALRRLYEDPKLRKNLGEHAREALNDRFSLARFKASVENYLRVDN